MSCVLSLLYTVEFSTIYSVFSLCIVTARIFLQPATTLPSKLAFFGIYNEVIAVPLKAFSPILSRLLFSLITMVFSDEQLKNAFFPIVFTLSVICISLKEVQLANAFSPISNS